MTYTSVRLSFTLTCKFEYVTAFTSVPCGCRPTSNFSPAASDEHVYGAKGERDVIVRELRTNDSVWKRESQVVRRVKARVSRLWPRTRRKGCQS